MKLPPSLLTAVAFGGLLPSGWSEPVILWTDAPPAAGITVREEMTIQLEKGSFSLGIGEKALAGSASAFIHDNFDRTFQSADRQSVQMHDSTRNIVFAFGKQSSPKDQEGKLSGKKLKGHKDEGHWLFDMQGHPKPDSAEAKALKQFSGYVEIIEALGMIYGPQPREVGDTWKPDLRALKRTPAAMDADLECKLEDVTPREGDKVARVSLHGHLNGNLGEAGKVKIELSGTFLRSLRDLMDLSMDLSGTFNFKGSFGNDGKSGASAEIKAPLNLKRTVRVESR